MLRFLLINPPSPEHMGTPLLGQQYVAAALLARGCEVKVIDAAARCARVSTDRILQIADDFRPDVIGFGLFTRWVFHAYQLANALRGRATWMVAGGAHVTACPAEALDHGFDAVLAGEAEQTIVQFAEAVAGRRSLETIPGLLMRGSDGAIVSGPPAAFVEDLDALEWPFKAQELFDSRWYDESGRTVIPGGILTSRGCPARCTFCANYVTGRGFRYRSSTDVVGELNAYYQRTGTTFFPFWDDALTANVPRVRDLFRALVEDVRFPVSWSAITRANMVTPDLLSGMRRAGCVSANFGVESGDDDVLRAIKKGVNTDQVVRAIEWAKHEELVVVCNFMLGFPEESPKALENTLRFMQRIAPSVDFFSTLGVVVPFPGTPLYDVNHRRYGFTDWWLKPEYGGLPPSPRDELDRTYRRYIDDANLDLDFFHYSEEIRQLIGECLKFKGEHNLRKMGLLPDPVHQPGTAVTPGVTA